MAPRRAPGGADAARTPVTECSYGSAARRCATGVRDYNAGDKAGRRPRPRIRGRPGPYARALEARTHVCRGRRRSPGRPEGLRVLLALADENADEAPDSPNAPVVASAFVALGTYFLDGIKNTYVRQPRAGRRAVLLRGLLFRRPERPVQPRPLYLTAPASRATSARPRAGSTSRPRRAMPRQALLGRMLVNGQGVPRERARGLMWLTLARESADPRKDQWIAELYDNAWASGATKTARSPWRRPLKPPRRSPARRAADVELRGRSRPDRSLQCQSNGQSLGALDVLSRPAPSRLTLRRNRSPNDQCPHRRASGARCVGLPFSRSLPEMLANPTMLPNRRHRFRTLFADCSIRAKAPRDVNRHSTVGLLRGLRSLLRDRRTHSTEGSEYIDPSNVHFGIYTISGENGDWELAEKTRDC